MNKITKMHNGKRFTTKVLAAELNVATSTGKDGARIYIDSDDGVTSYAIELDRKTLLKLLAATSLLLPN